MKIWKRAALCLAAAVMAAGMFITAEAAETRQKSSYAYTSGKTQFSVGDEWEKVHRALGKEKECKNLSCSAGSVRDKYYVYEDCDIYVAEEEGKSVIDTIVLKDGAETEEGLTLGQTPESVVSVYPDAVSEYGIYVSELGNTRIVVDCGIKDDKVVRISYERKK